MKIKVRMPEGAALDAAALAKGIGEALRAHREDASKIWRRNDVPAIAQLEEANYGPGSQELSEIFEAVARQLSLPTDAGAYALTKGVRRRPSPGQMGLGFEDEELGPVVKRERLRRETKAGPVQHSLEFDEEAHPRLGAGEAREGYQPGQFVPKEGAEQLHDEAEEDEEEKRTPTEAAIAKGAAWARTARQDVEETLTSDPSRAVLEDCLRRLNLHGDAHLKEYSATHPDSAVDKKWYAQVSNPWREMADRLEEALRPFQQSAADEAKRQLVERGDRWGKGRHEKLDALLASDPTEADLADFIGATNEQARSFEFEYNRWGLTDEFKTGAGLAWEGIVGRAKTEREALLAKDAVQVKKDAGDWLATVFARTQQASGTARELEAFGQQIDDEAGALTRRMRRSKMEGATEWRDEVYTNLREMKRNLSGRIAAAQAKEAAERFTLAGPKPAALAELAIPEEPQFWELLSQRVVGLLGREGSPWERHQHTQEAGRLVRNHCGQRANEIDARAQEARANGDEAAAARLEQLSGAVKGAGEAWKVLLDARGEELWPAVVAERERKRQEQEEREARLKAEDEAAARDAKKNPEGATEWRQKVKEIRATYQPRIQRADKKAEKEQDPEKRRELQEAAMALRVKMLDEIQPWDTKASVEGIAMTDFHSAQYQQHGGTSGLGGAWEPKDPPTHQAHWQPGRELTDAELTANGLEMRQTLLLTPEEDAALHQERDLGDDWHYYGPPTKEFLDAAHEEKDTTLARLPPQVRQKMTDAGAAVHVHAGPPMRGDYPDQAAYFDFLKKGDYANGRADAKLSWDTVGGFARGWQKLAKSRLGNSNPKNPWSSSGSVNVHLHEISHVLDNLYAKDGRDVSDTPQFRRIWQDFRAHVSDYQSNDKYGPCELFAEGLATFLESPANRALMVNGPGPYQRLAKFYGELLGMSEADLRKALRLMVTVARSPRKGAAPPLRPVLPSRFVAVQVQTPDGHFIIVEISRAEAEREGLLEAIRPASDV